MIVKQRGCEELNSTKKITASGEVYRGTQRIFSLKRTFLLSEAISSGGNAVPYAYAIVSEYIMSFPHEPCGDHPQSDLSTPRG